MKWVKKITWTYGGDWWWFLDEKPKKLGVSLSKLHLASLDVYKNDLNFENFWSSLGATPWSNGV